MLDVNWMRVESCGEQCLMRDEHKQWAEIFKNLIWFIFVFLQIDFRCYHSTSYSICFVLLLTEGGNYCSMAQYRTENMWRNNFGSPMKFWHRLCWWFILFYIPSFQNTTVVCEYDTDILDITQTTTMYPFWDFRKDFSSRPNWNEYHPIGSLFGKIHVGNRYWTKCRKHYMWLHIHAIHKVL